MSFLLPLSFLSRANDEASVLRVVVTGREGDDPFAVLRCDARIKAGERFYVLHVVVVARLIVEVLALVVLEMGGVVRVIDLTVKDREDLIISLFKSGIEMDDLVLVVIIDVVVLGQITEHGAVVHVVTVDQEMITVGITRSVHEQLAAFGVVAVKVGMQVLVVIIRYMHHRVVDEGVVDLHPSEEVVVLRVQRLIVGGELLQLHMTLLIGIRVEELDADDRGADEQQDDRDDSDNDDRRAGALFWSPAAGSVAVVIAVSGSSVIAVVIAVSAVGVALRTRLTASVVIIIIVALTRGILLTALTVITLTRGILLAASAVIALTRGGLLSTLAVIALTRRILTAASAVVALALLTLTADVIIAAVIIGVRVTADSSAVVFIGT